MILQMKFECIIDLTWKALDLVGVYFSAIHSVSSTSDKKEKKKWIKQNNKIK